jgi:hypothetical protein
VRHKHEIHTLSVIMPQSMALESVSRAASTRRVAIRRHASATVVVSGMVRALDNFSLLTVRSPGDLEFTKKSSQQLLPPFLLHRFPRADLLSPESIRKQCENCNRLQDREQRTGLRILEFLELIPTSASRRLRL